MALPMGNISTRQFDVTPRWRGLRRTLSVILKHVQTVYCFNNKPSTVTVTVTVYCRLALMCVWLESVGVGRAWAGAEWFDQAPSNFEDLYFCTTVIAWWPQAHST